MIFSPCHLSNGNNADELTLVNQGERGGGGGLEEFSYVKNEYT